uniref:Innexin n=1 Tax=Plectus sambesii TaxID=2011161 RepID=A0A914VR40_9BILA
MVLEHMLSMLTYLSPAKNDDFVDRLHYFWTSNFLLAMMVLVSWKSFGSHPLECMFPKPFPHSWEQTLLMPDEVNRQYEPVLLD